MFNSLRMIMNSGSILGYFLQIVPITILVAIVYCVIRMINLKRQNETVFWKKEVVKFIFVCYITVLINLIVMPANFWLGVMDGIAFGWWSEMPPVFAFGEINLVPSIIRWLQGELSIGSWVKQMLIGNIAMFLPFGFLLTFINNKVNKKNIWVIAISVPSFMELMQLILGRSLDVDDLICNFGGIIIGFLIAQPIENYLNKKWANLSLSN